MDAQGILPAIVIRTEPSPSLGPRRGGAPGRMGRAHGLPSSTVVRGTKTPPAKRTTVLPQGKRQQHPTRRRRSWGWGTTERPKPPRNELLTRFVWLALGRHLCKRMFVCT
jgi:hypothetical protein